MKAVRKVCKACRRVLEVVALDGEVTYRHHSQDRLADHPVVPVDPGEFSPRGRCDFCNADGPAFVLPARDFAVGVDLSTGAAHSSNGGWSACTECAVLIDANRWSDLSRHVQRAWEASHGIQLPPDRKTRNTRVWRLLRANITGSLRPIDPA